MTEMRSINKTVLLQQMKQRRIKLDELGEKPRSADAQIAANRAFDACVLRAELGALSAIYESLE
jgi:hypothetical protein